MIKTSLLVVHRGALLAFGIIIALSLETGLFNLICYSYIAVYSAATAQAVDVEIIFQK